MNGFFIGYLLSWSCSLPFHVSSHHTNTLYENTVIFRKSFEDFCFLSFVLTSDYDDLIIFVDFHKIEILEFSVYWVIARDEAIYISVMLLGYGSRSRVLGIAMTGT